MRPFPFYYEELPTFQRVIASLEERDFGVDWEDSWFTVCRRNNIYQIWNKEYIEALSKEILNLVGEGFVLEVAAGDGMLSHWLKEYGVNIKATDNMSWHKELPNKGTPIELHSEVEALDALEAIRKYKLRMVIVSWIPYGSKLDCEILDENPEYLILIGEGYGGCTGSSKFWGAGWDEDDGTLAYWRQKGYSEEDLDVDIWNICRTDYPWHSNHGSTTLYRKMGVEV
ncbi:hypothetical protein ES703_17059 [subsurface metagenome]